MSLAWIPYANGRAHLPPRTARPFAGILPLVLLPGALLAALALARARGAHIAPAVPTEALPPLVAVSQSLPSSPLPPQLTPTVQYWASAIQRWQVSYNLPASWIAIVIQIESCGDPSIRSHAGAAGLFQVMPFHFAAGEDSLDVETNAARGLSYLVRASSLASGDFGLALAGYNGGHGMIGRPPEEWPAETQRYVRWGTGILADVNAGTLPSPTLAAWLRAGGRRLCDQAASVLGLAPDTPSA